MGYFLIKIETTKKIVVEMPAAGKFAYRGKPVKNEKHHGNKN